MELYITHMYRERQCGEERERKKYIKNLNIGLTFVIGKKRKPSYVSILDTL